MKGHITIQTPTALPISLNKLKSFSVTYNNRNNNIKNTDKYATFKYFKKALCHKWKVERNTRTAENIPRNVCWMNIGFNPLNLES